jgi:hypothetical protein
MNVVEKPKLTQKIYSKPLHRSSHPRPSHHPPNTNHQWKNKNPSAMQKPFSDSREQLFDSLDILPVKLFNKL